MNAWQKGFLGSLIVIAIAWLYGINWDQRITDAHDHWRVALRREPFPSQILVIALDDRSLVKLKSFAGQIPRRHYARLLDRLHLARVVGIDMVLDETDPYDPAGDRELAAAVKRHGRVVLPLFAWLGAHPIDQESLRETAAILKPNIAPGQAELIGSLDTLNPNALQMPYSPLRQSAAALGYADTNADADNIYRRPILVRQTIDTGSLLPHFSLAVACLATRTSLSAATRNLPQQLWLGTTSIPLSSQGSVFLRPIARRGGDYRQHPGAPVPTLSFCDALQAPPETFQDKIILIGTTAAGTADIRATPIDNGMRGVELNAEILGNLLYRSPNRPLNLFVQWALILLAVSLPLYLFSTLSPHRAMLGTALTLIVLLAAMEIAYWTLYQVPAWSAILFGFGAATLLTSLQRLREEAAGRLALRRRFASYVAPEMVDRLLRDPAYTGQSARRVRAAILFADVRDFTAYSEQYPPDVVRRQIEDYLSEMAIAIHTQRGIVDKFLGDGVMALFGPFYESEGHEAAKAIACALDMMARLEDLNHRWQQQNLPPFRIGIGLQVGTVLFGEFGSPDRYTLTALGDDVNLASRLETSTKDFQAAILTTDAVEQETASLLGHLVRFEDMGWHILRGRTQATHLYSVRRRSSATPPVPAETTMKL